MALGLMVLCVAVCVAVAPAGADDAESWIAPVGFITFWGGLIGGPLVGAIVGARRMRRGPCQTGTADGKPGQ